MELNTLLPDTPDHNNTLNDLGLKAEWLNEIAQRVLTAYHGATLYDARTAAGSYAYFTAVKAAREVLCPQGWQPLQRNNLELIEHPEIGIVLTSTSGNENTGMVDENPKNKNKKGIQTLNIINQNARVQLKLFPSFEADHQIRSVEKTDSRPTWFLLYHIDPKKSEMRMELSLPVGMNSDGTYIDQLQKRIILDSLPFDPAVPSPIPEKEELVEIDFKIKRKY